MAVQPARGDAVTIFTFPGSHYARKLIGALSCRAIPFTVEYLHQPQCKKFLPYPYYVPVARFPATKLQESAGDIIRDTRDILKECDRRRLGDLQSESGGGWFYPQVDPGAEESAAQLKKVEDAEAVIDELYLYESVANPLYKLSQDPESVDMFSRWMLGVGPCMRCLIAGPMKPKVYDGMYEAKAKRAKQLGLDTLPPVSSKGAARLDEMLGNAKRALRGALTKVEGMLRVGEGTGEGDAWRPSDPTPEQFLGGGCPHPSSGKPSPTSPDFMLWALVGDMLGRDTREKPGPLAAEMFAGLPNVLRHHKMMAYHTRIARDASVFPGFPHSVGMKETFGQQRWLKAKLPRPVNPHPDDRNA